MRGQSICTRLIVMVIIFDPKIRVKNSFSVLSGKYGKLNYSKVLLKRF